MIELTIEEFIGWAILIALGGAIAMLAYLFFTDQLKEK